MKNKNLPDTFGNKDNILDTVTNPGDKLELRVTNSNRKVLKLQKENFKYSATKYPNGTIVETKVTKAR